ncbi:MAG: class II aldolase/adducin family protein, partial [Pseudomonadota bacterium]
VAFVPYRKPGLLLTEAIAEQMTDETRIFVLGNHGLIVAGETVSAVAALMDDVEARLALPARGHAGAPGSAPDGFTLVADAAALALDEHALHLCQAGSYYPDHVVFLGPALPSAPEEGRPAHIIPGVGAAIRGEATPAQRAMLTCLANVLSRLPADWTTAPIGPDAEAALLNWDAEKYRQALAARNA